MDTGFEGVFNQRIVAFVVLILRTKPVSMLMTSPQLPQQMI